MLHHWPTCVQNPQHQRKIAQANINITVQSHITNRNFFIATATLVTVALCFHNSALSCFILNLTFGILQQQETQYSGEAHETQYSGEYMNFQITKSNCPCRQGHMCELTLLHQSPLGMYWKLSQFFTLRILLHGCFASMAHFCNKYLWAYELLRNISKSVFYI